jgi:polyadenylate-binding protein
MQFFAVKGYQVHSATVASDAQHKKSLGYGYLAFSTKEEQARCLNEM